MQKRLSYRYHGIHGMVGWTIAEFEHGIFLICPPGTMPGKLLESKDTRKFTSLADALRSAYLINNC